MAMIDLNSRLERNPGLVWADMDGETVMMSMERGEYFGLGGVGSRIWDLLAEPVTAATVCEQITAEFDIDAAVCRADVVAFLQDLAVNGLVVLT